MMYQGMLLGLCFGMSLAGSAHGDLRVLFTFDSSGTKVDQVVEIAASGENYPATMAELPVSVKADTVMMRWLDAGGQLLAVTQVSDPRITSAPGHMNPLSVSRVGLTEGAWVSNGPDGAEQVVIEFPHNVALQLSLETWPVSLHRNN